MNGILRKFQRKYHEVLENAKMSKGNLRGCKEILKNVTTSFRDLKDIRKRLKDI